MLKDRIINFSLGIGSSRMIVTRKCRSVETALHDVVGSIKSALNKKEYVLASFLDIEGAFNNVKISSILESLSTLGIGQRIISWTGNMLKARFINSC